MENQDSKKETLAAFNRLHRQYYRRCVIYAQSYTGDEISAEDFASEAMLRLWIELDKGREIGHPGAFLMTTLKHLLLDHFRREQIKEKALLDIQTAGLTERDIHLYSLENTDPADIFTSEVEHIVRSALAKMPEQSRRIFYLSRVERMPHREIAEKMHISVKGVEYHITKVIKELRIQLKDYLPLLALFLINF